jgi:hypothetical protein
MILEARSDLGTLGTFLVAAIIMDQSHRTVSARVEKDFAQIGAALEKYRAEHNQYPETLDQLVPAFLPSVGGDRFAPKRAYGYSRGRPDAAGARPDAWILTSVGPDKRPDLPLDQFDPPAWSARLRSQDPQELAQVKRVVYRFRPEIYDDERKNDDEGDLFEMGGRGLRAPAPPAPKPPPPPKPRDPGAKQETF